MYHTQAFLIFFLLSIQYVYFTISQTKHGTMDYFVNIQSLHNASPHSLLQEIQRIKYINYNEMSDKELNYIVSELYKANPSNYVYSPVKNLNRLLEKFANEKCLIVINNFRGVHLIASRYTALILKQFNLAILTQSLDYKLPSIARYHLLWAPPELSLITNSTLREPEQKSYKKQFLRCSASKLFLPVELGVASNTDHCTAIHKNEFLKTSKLWQCEIQLDLFIPNYLLELGKITHIFRDHEGKGRMFVPSNIPQLNVLVHLDPIPVHSTKLHQWLNRKVVMYASESSYLDIVTDIQISASTQCRTKFSLGRSSCNIESMYVLKPCTHCSDVVEFVPLKMKKFSMEYILSSKFPKHNDGVMWTVTTSYASDETITKKAVDLLRISINENENYNVAQIIHEKTSMNFEHDMKNRQAMILVSFIKCLLGNVTKLNNDAYPYVTSIEITADNMYFLAVMFCNLTIS